MAGAKLLWVFEHLGEDPVIDLLLSRGGMSWFGGFAGGVLAGLVVMQRKRLPKVAILAAATPALAVGHAIGRIGCFLLGDAAIVIHPPMCRDRRCQHSVRKRRVMGNREPNIFDLRLELRSWSETTICWMLSIVRVT